VGKEGGREVAEGFSSSNANPRPSPSSVPSGPFKRALSRLLPRNPIFAELDEEALQELAELAHPQAFRSGELIFRPGSPVLGCYLILEGHVKLVQRAPIEEKEKEKKECLLKLLGPGELLGECALFSDGYIAYAQALGAVQAAFFDREGFLGSLRARPQLAVRLIERLSRELQAVQRRLIETSYEGIEGRLARLLLALGEKFGREGPEGLELGLRLSRTELAQLAGVSTETVIRALSAFRERGLIHLEGYRIVLADREGLQRLIKPLPIPQKELI